MAAGGSVYSSVVVYLAICVIFMELIQPSLATPKKKKKQVLTTPKFKKKRDFGEWGEWDRCPDGELATSVQYKVRGDDGGDDSGLNGVKLFCAPPETQEYSKSITSKQGSQGDYGSRMPCEGYITGFQMEGEDDYGKDCVGFTGMKFFCTGREKELASEVKFDWSTIKWTQEQRCLRNMAICGIKTRVEDPKHGKCGITELKTECCQIVPPKLCEHPADGWFTIAECDNRDGIIEYSCTFKKKKGIADVRKQTQGGESETGGGFTASYDLKLSYPSVESSFKAELAVSHKTKHHWSQETSNTFSEETTHEISFKVPPKVRTQIKQIVGSCGPVSVYTGIYQKVDTLKGESKGSVKALKEGDITKSTLEGIQPKHKPGPNKKPQTGRSASAAQAAQAA